MIDISDIYIKIKKQVFYGGRNSMERLSQKQTIQTTISCKVESSVKGGILAERMEKNYEDDTINLMPPFPRNMLLEVTNACNHSCIFCANSKSDRKRGYIDSKLAKKILQEAYMLGTRDVGFYATGEPLLNRDLEEYIKYAKELGYQYVYITTNGALLTEQRAENIVEAGIDSIKFSLNASNRKDYKFIHGKDDYDQVVTNLKMLNKLRKRYHKKFGIYVSCVLTRQTADTKEEFRKNIEEYADEIVFVPCNNVGGMMYEMNDILTIGREESFYPKNGICPLFFRNLYVSYEGYWTMCCTDFQNYLALKDLNECTLEEAWNSADTIELRKRHLEHDLKGLICDNCMNNRNEYSDPVNDAYATHYDYKQWSKINEIRTRLQEWERS